MVSQIVRNRVRQAPRVREVRSRHEVPRRPRGTEYYVFPYKQGSESATLLARALSGKVLRREGSTFVPRPWKRVINWGSTSCPYEGLNDPLPVSRAGNKLLTFHEWRRVAELGPRVPEWTEEKAVAQEWLRKSSVVCRHTLTGHSGQGIEIIPKGSAALPDAPLYVKYIFKEEEYRVHVFDGEVIDVQRKVRDPDREVQDWKVRSHSNGFIYIRQAPGNLAQDQPGGRLYKDLVSEDVKSQALKAMQGSGLDFGAVDVIVDKKGRAFVLEINCAPGLEGSSVNLYSEAIRRHYDS